MRFLTWLKSAVPVDGVYWRQSREPPSEPRGWRERSSNRLTDSHSLQEKPAEEAATSGGNNKWIHFR